MHVPPRIPDLPRDLETIVMKCLEREPARRYESARALAEDLRRLRDGETVDLMLNSAPLQEAAPESDDPTRSLKP